MRAEDAVGDEFVRVQMRKVLEERLRDQETPVVLSMSQLKMMLSDARLIGFRDASVAVSALMLQYHNERSEQAACPPECHIAAYREAADVLMDIGLGRRKPPHGA